MGPHLVLGGVRPYLVPLISEVEEGHLDLSALFEGSHSSPLCQEAQVVRLHRDAVTSPGEVAFSA